MEKKQKILLVEPNFPTKFANLGLMRISSFHKSKGDIVQFIKGEKKASFYPDKIYISSIFTYRYDETIKSVKFYKKIYPKSDIWVGGILASLRPELFEKEGVKVHKGLLKEVENYPPDYDIYPLINYSLSYTSRGCKNKCQYCVVPSIEGKIYSRNWLKDINPKFNKIIFMDNNWLAKDRKDWLKDIKLLKELVKKGVKCIDFNQSLDAREITEWHFKQMKGLPIEPMRFSFDHLGQDKFLQRAIKLSYKYGFKDCHIDCLFNWNDTVEDFYYRTKEVNIIGAVAIPMMYVPIDAIDKSFVGRNWTRRERDSVSKINPYQFGQFSSRRLDEFEYFFGKNAKEFKKLLNYEDIAKLTNLRMEKLKRDRLNNKK